MRDFVAQICPPLLAELRATVSALLPAQVILLLGAPPPTA